MKIQAAVYREVNKPMTIEELELEAPKEKEVLVKVAYTGWCHSDLHKIKGETGQVLPAVVGHEASGIVEEVGPGVTTLQKGDHVVLTWMVPCGTCENCVSGKGYLCLGNGLYLILGTMLDGTTRMKDFKGQQVHHQTFVSGFASHVVVPEKGAIKVREDLPLEQACFMGCALPTGFGAVYNAADVKPGDTVAVWGLGGVGLNVVLGAKLRNAYPIIGVDIKAEKEALAREFGITHFIDSSKEDPVPKVKELTGGWGAQHIFEVVGNPGSIHQAFWALAPFGKLVVVGICPETAMTELPLNFLTHHGKSVIGTLYGNIRTSVDIPRMADMVVRGDIPLGKLTTRYFDLEEINQVAQAMEHQEINGRWVCKWS